MPESSKKVRRPPRPAVVDYSIQSIGKSKKRDGEEFREKQVVSKKQNTDDDLLAQIAADINKFLKKKQEENKESKPSSMKQSALLTAKKPDDKVDDKTKNLIIKDDYQPRPPLPPPEGGTKLVYMENLHLDIKESDVVEFFKDDGKIVEVTFFGDDPFSGCGDVKFETSEAAAKALKRNGEVLIDRPVILAPSDDRTIFDFMTPKSDQNYLFMGNLSLSVEEKDIVEFFKDDGEVVSVSLMSEDYPFEAKKAVAHVQFASSTIAFKAFRRYGKMLRGCRVELALANEKTVWYSCTPSSSIPPRGPGWGPGWGPSFISCCSKCKKDLRAGRKD